MTDFPTPAWLKKLPKEKRAAARTRFLIRLAALYATEGGSMSDLSLALGYNRNSLGVCAGRDEIAPKTAIAIEKKVGAALFPRAFLNPDMFKTGS